MDLEFSHVQLACWEDAHQELLVFVLGLYMLCGSIAWIPTPCNAALHECDVREDQRCPFTEDLRSSGVPTRAYNDHDLYHTAWSGLTYCWIGFRRAHVVEMDHGYRYVHLLQNREHTS